MAVLERVLGKVVQYDNSGVGHNWKRISKDDLGESIVEEIEAEILDGGKSTTDLYVAKNGLHYRW